MQLENAKQEAEALKREVEALKREVEALRQEADAAKREAEAAKRGKEASDAKLAEFSQKLQDTGADIEHIEEDAAAADALAAADRLRQHVRNPAVKRALDSLMPKMASKRSGLLCGCCGVKLSTAACYVRHQCSRAMLGYDRDLSDNGRCTLCRSHVWDGENPHHCVGVSSVVINTVGMSTTTAQRGHSRSSNVHRSSEEHGLPSAAACRDAPGLHVSLFEYPAPADVIPRCKVSAHMFVVATASNPSMGLGLYTVTGMSSKCKEIASRLESSIICPCPMSLGVYADAKLQLPEPPVFNRIKIFEKACVASTPLYRANE
jgi:hypothetical protein